MAKRIVQFGLYFIGISAILIGSAIALFGIELVGRFFSAIINVAIHSGPVTDLGHPNDDSELRFYSVFFIAFGFLMVQSARHFETYRARIPHLLALFFAGGVTRALGVLAIGIPHNLFLLLMGIELILPPLLFLAWRNTDSPSK